MEKKRKLPARAAARVDADKKKKPSVEPEKVPSPSPAPPPPPPEEKKEEPLPTALVPGKPLPTIEKAQPNNLPLSQWQSIQESGIMAESLSRSRHKWMHEALFQKYWSKPTKKKGVVFEEAGNPPKDSMVKVGPCTMYVEPHVFEITLYTVKDNSARQQFQHPPQPAYRPIIQYGPPNGVMPPPQIPQQPAAPMQVIQMQPGPPTPSRLQDAQRMNGAPSPAPSQNGTPTPQHNVPRPSPGSAPHTPQAHPQYQAPSAPAAQPPAAAPAPPAAPPSKQSDPVIQMLAERAATDPELKGLMRIVADGKASPEELKRFQGHIDELTKLLHTRQAAMAAAAPAQSNGTPGPPPNIIRQPPPQPAPVRPPPQQQPPPPQQYYAPPPQPQALRSRAPPPPRSDISAVVFDFAGGSGDRFLFPKHSIVDQYGPTKAICSFLIIRRGTKDDEKADPTIDFYQPVTIRLEAPNNPRMLDILPRAVAHPEEVRRYMNGVMDTMTRAEYVLLAMQLPREGVDLQAPAKEEDVTMNDAPVNDNNGVLWQTNAVQEPLKPQKAIKQPLTEEQQHSNFIASVS